MKLNKIINLKIVIPSTESLQLTPDRPAPCYIFILGPGILCNTVCVILKILCNAVTGKKRTGKKHIGKKHIGKKRTGKKRTRKEAHYIG